MDQDRLDFLRRVSKRDVTRRRTTTNLRGRDVVAYCANCDGPIFRDSRDAATRSRAHAVCPQVR